MAQPDPRSPKNNRPPNGNGGADPNFNWRGLFLFALAICLFAGFYVLSKNTGMKEVSYPDFVKLLEEDKIDKTKGIDLVSEPSATDYVTGTMKASKDPPPAREIQDAGQFAVQYLPAVDAGG